jgi:hypothetical protein
MSDIIPNQKVEHETKVYSNQTVKVYEMYGRWHFGKRTIRVYALGMDCWTTNIQLAMIQQRAEYERNKRSC